MTPAPFESNPDWPTEDPMTPELTALWQRHHELIDECAARTCAAMIVVRWPAALTPEVAVARREADAAVARVSAELGRVAAAIAAAGEDATVALFRRMRAVERWAQQLNRIAERYLGTGRPQSAEERKAAAAYDRACAQAARLERALLLTPVTSPAGLLLFATVLQEHHLQPDGSETGRAFPTMIASIRQLFPAEALAPAEQLLAEYADVTA